jgi:branched-chain amino acid aminotransferase
VQEAIMLNHLGHVAEATGDNIFALSGSVLTTPSPSCGCLVGITRDTVMRLATQAGLDVREGCMTRYDFYTADEVFLTGTAAEVVPVVEIDRRVIGAGVPGAVTKRLIAALREFAGQPGSGIPIA